MSEKDVLGALLEAVNFAAKKHRDQRRKDKYQTPYINHPIGCAYLLWKEGGVTDITVLQVRKLVNDFMYVYTMYVLLNYCHNIGSHPS